MNTLFIVQAIASLVTKPSLIMETFRFILSLQRSGIPKKRRKKTYRSLKSIDKK